MKLSDSPVKRWKETLIRKCRKIQGVGVTPPRGGVRSPRQEQICPCIYLSFDLLFHHAGWSVSTPPAQETQWGRVCGVSHVLGSPPPSGPSPQTPRAPGQVSGTGCPVSGGEGSGRLWAFLTLLGMGGHLEPGRVRQLLTGWSYTQVPRQCIMCENRPNRMPSDSRSKRAQIGALRVGFPPAFLFFLLIFLPSSKL